jgi:hypothetical protein
VSGLSKLYCICIPIVFHGTPENFIINRTTIKNCFIFSSVSHGPNDNLQYITRPIKKNLIRPTLKNDMCPLKKKSWPSQATENNAKKIYFMAASQRMKNHIFGSPVHWNRITNKKVMGWGVFHQTACIQWAAKVWNKFIKK